MSTRDAIALSSHMTIAGLAWPYPAWFSAPCCPARPCPYLSCPVLSSPALPCPVLSCPVLPCPPLPCPVLSVLSSPVLSCPALSCPVLSYPVLPCPVLSCPALPCPVLSCPALSCPQSCPVSIQLGSALLQGPARPAPAAVPTGGGLWSLVSLSPVVWHAQCRPCPIYSVIIATARRDAGRDARLAGSEDATDRGRTQEQGKRGSRGHRGRKGYRGHKQ